jgi:hypothetical protein
MNGKILYDENFSAMKEIWQFFVRVILGGMNIHKPK